MVMGDGITFVVVARSAIKNKYFSLRFKVEHK